MKKVLVVSVHPDDETLGCGGAILKHKEKGDKIYCIHVTNGNEYQQSIVDKIDSMFDFDEIVFFNLPELDLDDLSLNKLIPKFTKVFNRIKPEVLYIPNRSDVHSDHRKVFEALISSSKSFRFPFIKKILMCEIISETDFAPPLMENAFIPNCFSDITNYFEKKLEIIRIFEKELLDKPYTRSYFAIEALSKYRGSQINVKYAEAFMLIKEIF